MAWSAFFALLLTYWLTVAPGVSFWDCPEYVSAAALLEVGHPPGNPTWMLAARMFTLFAPEGGHYAALAVNLSSGLFTAFAGFFLSRTVFNTALWVLRRARRRAPDIVKSSAGAALTASLMFGWCDSAWYSAVEAEVYAMSIFMTSLCVWLTVRWAMMPDGLRASRQLVLIAYMFGLSLGVHQLNLLCIPALAMIFAIRRGIRSPGKVILIFLLSLAAVGFILVGVMPWSIALAAWLELMAVNGAGLPALSGVVLFIAVPGAMLIASLRVTARSSRTRRLNLALWMLAMLLTGYSSYALIPVRGGIPSPANASLPGNPFSFAEYQAREQYGSKPLLYGPTPYSKAMYEEDTDSVTGQTRYTRYALERGHRRLSRAEAGAGIADPLGMLTARDSAINAAMLERANAGKAGYVTQGYRVRTVPTPELNMLFPRMTGTSPFDLDSYASWVGMDTSTMERVNVTEAFDADGNPVTKMDGEGRRGNPVSWRPTMLQNLEWLVSYQIGYMYLRYLMWNFSGRQNDVPSQGEVQHGNFITGFTAVDNLMLGAEDALPASAGRDNPGRNRYFMLPLLLCLLGAGWLCGQGRRGRQAAGTVAVLFIMTGLAIVVYLNQGPGEPRERDYSFLGSFLAFSIWGGFGAVAVARMCRSAWGFLIPLGIAGWMFAENLDDHDRSGRTAAANLSANILNSMERDAILFVNGDNYTFPLWYLQEVEGVRRDVKVINLAYIALPEYAAARMGRWRESLPLQTTLTRQDIIYGALRYTKAGSAAGDTLGAVEALRALRASDTREFPGQYVRLRVSADSVILYNLRSLSGSGASRTLDFGRLMVFDIVATNAESAHPRPLYWLRQIRSDGHIRLADAAAPWLFGSRYGMRPEAETDSLLLDAAAHVVAPNADPDAYMDRTPAGMVASQRFALTVAAARLLEHGNIDGAEKLVRTADTRMGDGPYTYANYYLADTTVNSRRMLADVLAATADSLENRYKDSTSESDSKSGTTPASSRSRRIMARAAELRARAACHRAADRHKTAAWQHYRRSLPTRLRSKMSPVE